MLGDIFQNENNTNFQSNQVVEEGVTTDTTTQTKPNQMDNIQKTGESAAQTTEETQTPQTLAERRLAKQMAAANAGISANQTCPAQGEAFIGHRLVSYTGAGAYRGERGLIVGASNGTSYHIQIDPQFRSDEVENLATIKAAADAGSIVPCRVDAAGDVYLDLGGEPVRVGHLLNSRGVEFTPGPASLGEATFLGLTLTRQDKKTLTTKPAPPLQQISAALARVEADQLEARREGTPEEIKEADAAVTLFHRQIRSAFPQSFELDETGSSIVATDAVGEYAIAYLDAQLDSPEDILAAQESAKEGKKTSLLIVD